MAWQICFPTTSGELSQFGRRICIPLHVEMPKFPPVGPEPDPRSGLDVQEILTLASIDTLAEQLSGDAGMAIRRSVEARMMAINESLGADAGLSRMSMPHKAAAE